MIDRKNYHYYLCSIAPRPLKMHPGVQPYQNQRTIPKHDSDFDTIRVMFFFHGQAFCVMMSSTDQYWEEAMKT